jgi:hypothetical protein
MKPIRLLLSAIFLLFPVVLWNTWLLDYIDKSGKLVPWLLTAPIAFISTGILQGFSDVSLKITGIGPEGPNRPQFNPFWGWFIVALAIEVMITALSNT